MELSAKQYEWLKGSFVLTPPDRILERLASVEASVRELRQAIGNIPKPLPFPKIPSPPKVDIAPLIQRLDDLEGAIGRIAQPVSLEPVLSSIAKLGKTAAAPTKAPTYDFEIERDADGKIIKVTARPQSTARTILKG